MIEATELVCWVDPVLRDTWQNSVVLNLGLNDRSHGSEQVKALLKIIWPMLCIICLQITLSRNSIFMKFLNCPFYFNRANTSGKLWSSDVVLANGTSCSTCDGEPVFKTERWSFRTSQLCHLSLVYHTCDEARVITRCCPGRTVQSCVLAVLWMPCTAGRAETISGPHNCGSAPAQPFMWICSRCPSRCSQRQEAFPPTPGTSYARPSERGLSLPGTAGLMVRLDDIRGLIQPTQLYDSTMRDQLVANKCCFYTGWQAESPRKGSGYNKTPKLCQMRAERSAARGSREFPFVQARPPGPCAGWAPGRGGGAKRGQRLRWSRRSSLCNLPEHAAGQGSAADIAKALMCADLWQQPRASPAWGQAGRRWQPRGQGPRSAAGPAPPAAAPRPRAQTGTAPRWRHRASSSRRPGGGDGAAGDAPPLRDTAAPVPPPVSRCPGAAGRARCAGDSPAGRGGAGALRDGAGGARPPCVGLSPSPLPLGAFAFTSWALAICFLAQGLKPRPRNEEGSVRGARHFLLRFCVFPDDPAGAAVHLPAAVGAGVQLHFRQRQQCQSLRAE